MPSMRIAIYLCGAGADKFNNSAPHTRREADGLSIDFYPSTRNFTFHDARINLTLQFMFSGASPGWPTTDHEGVRAVTNPSFEPELRRLGLHPDQPVSSRPDILLAGTVRGRLRLFTAPRAESGSSLPTGPLGHGCLHAACADISR